MIAKHISHPTALDFIRETYSVDFSHTEIDPHGTESLIVVNKSGSTPWIAKLFPSHTPFEKIQKEAELCGYINTMGQAHNLRAPHILPNKQGALVSVLEWNNEQFGIFLMEWEAHHRLRPAELTREVLHTMGEKIASLHQLLSHHEEEFGFTQREWLEVSAISSVENTFRTSSFFSNFPTEKADEYTHAIQWGEKYVREYTMPENLSLLPLHGDLALEQARQMGDGQWYFFDWTDRFCGPWEFELGTFLFHLYKDAPLDYEQVRTFQTWVVGGYTQGQPVEPSQNELIFITLLHRTLKEIADMSAHSLSHRDYDVDPHFTRRCDMILELSKRMGKML